MSESSSLDPLISRPDVEKLKIELENDTYQWLFSIKGLRLVVPSVVAANALTKSLDALTSYILDGNTNNINNRSEILAWWVYVPVLFLMFSLIEWCLVNTITEIYKCKSKKKTINNNNINTMNPRKPHNSLTFNRG